MDSKTVQTDQLALISVNSEVFLRPFWVWLIFDEVTSDRTLVEGKLVVVCDTLKYLSQLSKMTWPQL